MSVSSLYSVDLVLRAAREASWAAHRWRDCAATHYSKSRFGHATYASRRKRFYYDLKERGIHYLHQCGALRYAGASPQGMAVYEYGDGGTACLHSCLHPAGAERLVVDNHPEILEVAAKRRHMPVSEIKTILESLDTTAGVYERSAAPTKPRAELICRRCGEVGHIAKWCTEVQDEDDLW